MLHLLAISHLFLVCGFVFFSACLYVYFTLALMPIPLVTDGSSVFLGRLVVTSCPFLASGPTDFMSDWLALRAASTSQRPFLQTLECPINLKISFARKKYG